MSSIGPTPEDEINIAVAIEDAIIQLVSIIENKPVIKGFNYDKEVKPMVAELNRYLKMDDQPKAILLVYERILELHAQHKYRLLEYLAKGFQNSPIELLDMSYLGITPEQLLRCLYYLGNLKKLSALVLRNNALHLTNEIERIRFTEKLAEFVKHTPSLLWIDLNGNNISKEAAKYISDIITKINPETRVSFEDKMNYRTATRELINELDSEIIIDFRTASFPLPNSHSRAPSDSVFTGASYTTSQDAAYSPPYRGKSGFSKLPRKLKLAGAAYAISQGSNTPSPPMGSTLLPGEPLNMPPALIGLSSSTASSSSSSLGSLAMRAGPPLIGLGQISNGMSVIFPAASPRELPIACDKALENLINAIYNGTNYESAIRVLRKSVLHDCSVTLSFSGMLVANRQAVSEQDNDEYTEKTIDAILSSINNISLNELNGSNNQLDIKIASKIVAMLDHKPIHILNLANNLIGNNLHNKQEKIYLSRFLENSKLYHLNLQQNNFSIESAIVLVHNLPLSLEILDLSNNPLNNGIEPGPILQERYRAFGVALKKNRFINKLELQNCGITIQELLCFLQGLEGSTIEELNIAGNPITLSDFEKESDVIACYVKKTRIKQIIFSPEIMASFSFIMMMKLLKISKGGGNAPVVNQYASLSSTSRTEYSEDNDFQGSYSYW